MQYKLSAKEADIAAAYTTFRQVRDYGDEAHVGSLLGVPRAIMWSDNTPEEEKSLVIGIYAH